MNSKYTLIREGEANYWIRNQPFTRLEIAQINKRTKKRKKEFKKNGIEINLLSLDTAEIVAEKLRKSIEEIKRGALW